jgi:hypothetical protein
MLVPPGHAEPGGHVVHCLFWVVVQAKVSYVVAVHVAALQLRGV